VQVERQVAESGDLGGEFERVCKTGNVLPDMWMTAATGEPVGPEALLEATAGALTLIR
jgi:hypothetical protein